MVFILSEFMSLKQTLRIEFGRIWEVILRRTNEEVEKVRQEMDKSQQKVSGQVITVRNWGSNPSRSSEKPCGS